MLTDYSRRKSRRSRLQCQRPGLNGEDDPSLLRKSNDDPTRRSRSSGIGCFGSQGIRAASKTGLSPFLGKAKNGLIGF